MGGIEVLLVFFLKTTKNIEGSVRNTTLNCRNFAFEADFLSLRLVGLDSLDSILAEALRVVVVLPEVYFSIAPCTANWPNGSEMYFNATKVFKLRAHCL